MRTGPGRAARAATALWKGLLGAACVGLSATAAEEPAESADQPPNLVVIMADDLGYADVGFNGCTDIPTPHIDSIAANGVTFTNGYVSYPVCGPSRAGFITGRYQGRFGFGRNPRYRPHDAGMGLARDETTLATALGTVGYHSGIIGKWHLGAAPPLHPLARGFDEFFGHLGGGHRYFPEELTIRDSAKARDEAESYRTWIIRDRQPVRTTRYLTDEFSDEAVRFVERNRTRPFFLFLSYNAPHGPLQATETYLSRFPHIRDETRRTYAAMVSAVDDGVGRVLGALNEAGVEENTMVFFLSDNGGPTTKNGSCNEPLRGGKSDVWEGGYRVPFALQWPAKIGKGTTFDHPVLSLDIFATIAARAGYTADPARPLDGVDLLPHLGGQAKAPPHATTYLRKFDQGRYAVRHGDLKLVIPGPGQAAHLYNLREDLAETRNIAADHPGKVATLESFRARWNAELVDPAFAGLQQRGAGKPSKGGEGKGKRAR